MFVIVASSANMFASSANLFASLRLTNSAYKTQNAFQDKAKLLVCVSL